MRFYLKQKTLHYCTIHFAICQFSYLSIWQILLTFFIFLHLVQDCQKSYILQLAIWCWLWKTKAMHVAHFSFPTNLKKLTKKSLTFQQFSTSVKICSNLSRLLMNPHPQSDPSIRIQNGCVDSTAYVPKIWDQANRSS